MRRASVIFWSRLFQHNTQIAAVRARLGRLTLPCPQEMVDAFWSMPAKQRGRPFGVHGRSIGFWCRRAPQVALRVAAPLPIAASLLAVRGQCLGCDSGGFSANRDVCQTEIGPNGLLTFPSAKRKLNKAKRVGLASGAHRSRDIERRAK